MEFTSFLLPRMVVVCFLLYLNGAAAVTLLPNETDHLALMAFKAAITDDPLEILSSWNSSLHFCNWEGISCSNRHKQRVVSLNLNSSRLGGLLSPHIGNLSFLKTLSISNNSFTGEIPSEVTRLFRLQTLTLENNTFGGEIPMNLSYCSDIQILNIRRNNLRGRIPTQLGSLKKMEFLGLGGNNLMGEIPNSLGNLSSLENFDLRVNNLTGTIPRDLARLQRLRIFAVDDNHLSGTVPPQLYNISSIYIFSIPRNQHLEGSLPSDIGLTLPNLQWLAVGENRFTGTIPISLLNCSELFYLELFENMFSGQVPSDIGKLQRLRYLYGHINNFGTGEGSKENDLQFLSSLTNCTSLRRVGMSENALTGSLPDSLGNLSSQFFWLGLEDNYVYGGIPSGIGDLVSLNYLSLQNNSISGNVPDTFGKLSVLQQLDLSSNSLTSRIPSSLGNLTQLGTLSLSHNKLDGTLPSSLGNCQNLISLDLSFNNLTDTIPIQVFDLISLSRRLDLAHNSLTGPLPVEVGKLNNLEVLDVSNNKFSGGIPHTLGQCTSLRKVFMQGNMFEEEIPESLSALRGIDQMDLSHNNLSGKIPGFLGDLPFINFLNLSFNDFEGAVPQEGIFRNASVFEVDGNPKLCGGSSELGLPLCQTLASRIRGKSPSLKVIIPIVVCVCLVLLVLSLLMLQKRRMSVRGPLTSSDNFRHLRISYADLATATNSFSEANLLGVGTYSHVYKGILEHDGMVVAVKVLNLQQRGASKSFTSECEALRNVRHRNIVKIFTSCSSLDFQGNIFKALVFEFMPNGNLEKWLYPEAEAEDRSEFRNLDLLQRLNIAVDVAAALNHLHHHSQPTIIHSDLKPSNILLDSGMTAHVGDFGLAKIFSLDDFGQSQTNSYAIKGSIGYVAPEYGLGTEVSTQGDVYSYGILLIEMFTGKRPTNDLFRDGLTLHRFAKMSLPERVVEIIDPRLLVEGTGGKMQEFLVKILEIGIACSMESPKDRLEMDDVVMVLSSIKEDYGVHILGETSKSYTAGSHDDDLKANNRKPKNG